MPKKFHLSDLAVETKPRIRPVRRWFGDVCYTFECKGRSSVGYGTTAEHAYRTWQANWRRRKAFYERRELGWRW